MADDHPSGFITNRLLTTKCLGDQVEKRHKCEDCSLILFFCHTITHLLPQEIQRDHTQSCDQCRRPSTRGAIIIKAATMIISLLLL